MIKETLNGRLHAQSDQNKSLSAVTPRRKFPFYMTKWMMAVAFAAMVAAKIEAAPANKMRLKMAEMLVKTAEEKAARYKTGTMVKTSVREARERVDELMKTSSDDPAVVVLDGRLKVLEDPFKADAKERADAQKAKEEKLAAEKKAAAEAQAAKKAALAHKAELPWVMQKTDRDAITKYINELGKMTDSKQVEDLKKALEARAEEDRKIVEAKGDESDAAKEELDRYELFLDQLGHQTLVGYFEGNIDLDKHILNFKELRVRTHNSSVYVRTCRDDKKLYFYEMNGARGYVEGEDIDAVKEAQRRFYYVDFFLKDKDNTTYRKNSAAARAMFDYIKKALANNSPDKIEFAPMPKKGPLHDQFAKAALETIKTQADSYKDVYEVIIDANSWQTETKFGGIVRRKFGGWGLKKLKHGIRAYRVQWCQDHLGGGKYADLRLYATAGGSMYVK
jgi:hypothetical protein